MAKEQTIVVQSTDSVFLARLLKWLEETEAMKNSTMITLGDYGRTAMNIKKEIKK